MGGGHMGGGGWGGGGYHGGWGGGYGGYGGYGLGYPGYGWGGYQPYDYSYYPGYDSGGYVSGNTVTDGQTTTGYWPQSTANPVPQVQTPIKVVNPANSGATLSFIINGQSYSLAPGMKQDLNVSPGSTVSFDRGGNLGTATYSLNQALYSFAPSNHGWELFQEPLPASGGQAAAATAARTQRPPTRRA